MSDHTDSYSDNHTDDNTDDQMRIGIGLPAAIPGADATSLGEWAARAERLGFRSASVIDRLVYDNLEPLVALAAAAARTERIELMTTVLNVPYRRNAVLVAKQLASVERISGGRLTAGFALGGWPEDYQASGLDQRGTGAAMDAMVAAIQQVWAGTVAGASGPMPALDPGRPGLLFGGFAPASFARAAADHYIAHYYGEAFYPAARADTLTDPDQLGAELTRLASAGADDLILLPCSADLTQVDLLAAALPEPLQAQATLWRSA